MNKKQMQYIVVLTAVMVGTLCMLGTRAYAQGNWGAGKGDRQAKWEQRKEKMFDQLGLSDEQKAQLKANREQQRSAGKALREELKAKREEFKKELQKVDFDVNRLKQINEELKSLKNQMADHRLNAIIAVRQILTPEQYAKFVELRKNAKDRRQKQGGGDSGRRERMKHWRDGGDE